MFEYEFMKNSLAAVLLITPLFGLLGTMIVNNKMAFFSDGNRDLILFHCFSLISCRFINPILSF